MGRACIFLAMPTMAQVKAVELTFYLKAHGTTQTRTEMISHQNSFHGLWVKTHNALAVQRDLAPRSGGKSVAVQPIVKSFFYTSYGGLFSQDSETR